MSELDSILEDLRDIQDRLTDLNEDESEPGNIALALASIADAIDELTDHVTA